MNQIFDNIKHNFKIKNILSLSYNDELRKYFSSLISKQIPDFSIEYYNKFFSLLKYVWKTKIKIEIENFIENSSSVIFVFPKDIPQIYKNSIVNEFNKKNLNITTCCLDDLKVHSKVEKFVVFQYRSANSRFRLYPNSFDPLPLNNEQESLTIINNLTHGNFLEWDNFWWLRAKNGLLYSKFRKENLGWEKTKLARPTSLNVKLLIDEADEESISYQADRCRVYFLDKTKDFFANERVICEIENERRIVELRNIADLENISIQVLSELVEQVKSLISDKIEANSNVENIIRRDSKYELSENEINSNIELWKILLNRKVSMFGFEKVYNEIFSSEGNSERISLNTFKQWNNLDGTMILPRSRKDQKHLLTYLGFQLGSIYHRIISSKKISSINGSRLLNTQIENILRKALLKAIDFKTFDSLIEENTDIFTLLDINDIGDLKALIDLLEINLTKVKRIEYDAD